MLNFIISTCHNNVQWLCSNDLSVNPATLPQGIKKEEKNFRGDKLKLGHELNIKLLSWNRPEYAIRNIIF